MARFLLPALVLVFCLPPSQAAAQGGRIDESPLYNRLATGAGARAWGMAGAQIAVPGEGEAITWNPAAIGTLGRPHLSFSFSGDRLAGDLTPTTYRSPSGQRVGLIDIGSITPTLSHASGRAIDFAAVVFPFNVARRRVVAGLAYDTHLSFSGSSAESVGRNWGDCWCSAPGPGIFGGMTPVSNGRQRKTAPNSVGHPGPGAPSVWLSLVGPPCGRCPRRA